MERGARCLACQAVIFWLLCWIIAVQGSSISVPCIDNNCTATRIGDPCSSQADCSAITSSQCQNEICSCPTGYLPTNESKECVSRTISDQCQVDSDCSNVIDNSHCNTNRTCSCSNGYLFDGFKCLARKLDDACTKNRDCTKVMNNTRCFKKKCKCKNLYLREDSSTCRPRSLVDNCTNSNECNPEGGTSRVCSNGSCECAKGYQKAPNDTLGEFSCVKIKPGSRCSKNKDCQHVPYSKCGTDQTCQCVQGRRASNETCDVIQLNEDCLDNMDCKNSNNSLCVQGHCSCEPGYTQDVDGRYCQAVLLGDPCRANSDCSVANSVCNSSSVCSCRKGFESLDRSSQCTEMVIEDTKCGTSEDCFEHFPNTVCTSTGFCRCEPQYYLSPNGTQCLLRYIGDPCTNDAECLYSVQLTQCDNHTCQCIHTHLPTSDKTSCRYKILGGLKCSVGDCEQWAQFSHCDVDDSSTDNSSICFCNTGYFSSENYDKCLEKRIFDLCLTNADCSTTNPDSFCSDVSQNCQCLPEFIPTFPEDKAVSAGAISTASKPFCSRRIIGDQSCETVKDCFSAIANSTCGPCQDASDDSPCLQRCHVLAGTAGSPDSPNSTNNCLIKTCICDKGFIASSDRQRCERRKLREPCRTDEDCSALIPNSLCLPGISKCFCAPGFREDGSYQCTKNKLRDLCIKDSDCQEAVSFSHCNFTIRDFQHFGVCQCNSGYHGNDAGTECRKRQIGDRTCMVPTDCSDAINNSYCHLGMCVCVLGYYRSYDHTQCNKRRLYHDYCDDNPDCDAAVPNAVCNNTNRCICPSGYTDIGEECRKRNLDDACTLGTDCSDAVGNSTCVGGVCRCVSGYVAVDNDTCVRRKIFDTTCENLHDCADAVEKSNCRNGTCLCDTGYYPFIDGTVCLPRKLGDACSETPDCLSVIENSNCVTQVCACLGGYDAHANNSRCVPQPTYIGDLCFYTEQCQKVDRASTCNLTRQQPTWRCLCPPGTFTAVNRTTCVKLPTGIGDHCTHHEHCKPVSENSACVNFTCSCSVGYFPDNNRTTCHRDPAKFGDYCQEDEHCNKTLDKSKCELDNNTCVCVYGYTQNTARSCVERDILPQYTPIAVPEPTTCALKCDAWTNSRCDNVTGVTDKQCRCDFRHALQFNTTQCVPIQTYQIHLYLTEEAGKYDYEPLEFKKEYLSPKLPIYEEFANRITVNGLMKLFNETWSSSPLKDRYVASEVIRFQKLDVNNQATNRGVKATVLLHLTADYLDATPVEELYNFFEENLNSSGGLLGRSALKVATPYRQAVVFRDFDECEFPDRNDCHRYATCINTLGSFMCVCKPRYEDASKRQNKRPGRDCVVPSTTQDASDLCSSDGCKTNWDFVALAVTLFLLIVMAFITYEIIQRKQTFTARKLYEKFGTTKIRKLRQASMHRLQERKKRKKEENKTKKEEEKQKKEDLKKEKNEQKRLKDEERKMKQEEKRQKDFENKEAKKSKKGKTSDDVEWFGEDEDRESSSEPAHSPPSPYLVTTDDDIGSLPGSVNSPETEMTFPKMVTSHIEESNV